MSTKPSKAWFAPKRYGYGAGLPIAWQGWAVLAAYFVIVSGAPFVLLSVLSNPVFFGPAFIAITLVSTIVLIIICMKTTKGGWHWRWDGKP
ncbi:MAG: hypothetical protein QM647_02305 [Asticcacaulis sp.]|uniref:hypothetical protein n=1 Tax=Asticcacaulis sp. TaxID=1872648 RepID=UPI0039E724FE